MKPKILLLAFATTIFALTSKAQVSFGLRAGVNLQNITGKNITGEELEFDLKTGYHIGVNAEIGVAPDFYVQPGLLFNTKGAKEKVNNDDDIKINLSYVEMPINLIYKPSLGVGRLLLGFGPYVAYAVGGSVKAGENEGEVEFENEITGAQYTAGFFSGTYYYKRLDVGGNLLFGYEFAKKISVQLNAQLGMAKINPKISDYSSDKSKAKNTGFGLSVGYRF